PPGAGTSTADPRTSPLRSRSRAWLASASGWTSTSVRTGTRGAMERNSSPSWRVRFATDRRWRSPQRIEYGKLGMSLVWMPAQPRRVPRQPQSPVPDQARAEQRRGLEVRIAVGDGEAEALVGHGMLGVAAVEVVAGEPSPDAQVLLPSQAEATDPARPAKPWDPH